MINEQMLYNGYNCTPLQIEYLRFIIEYKRDNDGNSPAHRELARHFGVHWNTARGHLFELSNKRLIHLLEGGGIVVEGGEWRAPEHIHE